MDPKLTGKCLTAYLDDFPLLNIDNLTWGPTEGVFPRTAVVNLLPEFADQLYKYAKSIACSRNPFVTLRMNYEGLGPLVFTKIYVTGYGPHSTPYFKQIKIADIRWTWPRKHIYSNYNVRTKANDKFVDSTTNINVDNLQDIPQDIFDNISYKSFSMNPRPQDAGNKKQEPFSLGDIFEDLFEIHNAIADEDRSPRLKYNIPKSIFKELDQIRREELRPDSSFQVEMRRFLDLVPRIGIYPDNNGVIQFYDKLNGGEVKILNDINTPPHVGGGVVEYVTNEVNIPRRIHVLYTPEMELRFDYTSTGGVGSEVPKVKEERFLENIIPNPVPFLEVNETRFGKAVKRKVYQGEYMEMQAFIDAVQSLPEGFNVSEEKIRRHWMDGGMFRAWVYAGEVLDLDRDWRAIVGAIVASYRSMFRPNKNWRDKVINWKPSRVAIVDQATGYQTKSPIYTNYALEYSVRGIVATKKWIRNITGWNADIDQAERCPFANVSISDVENGIINIFYSDTSQTRQISRVFPSQVDNAPTLDLTDRTKPRFYNETSSTGVKPTLTANHNLSVIVSGTPAGTNTGVSLFDDVVEIKDVSAGLRKRLDGACGQDWYLRVPASLATLRTVWSDKPKAVEAIEGAFGVFRGEGKDQQKKIPTLKTMEDLNLVLNRKEIRDLSLSMAEAFLTPFIHRYKGSKTGFFTKTFPNGTIGEIHYGISSDGNPTVSIRIPDQIVKPNPLNGLPAGSRDFILHHVQPE